MKYLVLLLLWVATADAATLAEQVAAMKPGTWGAIAGQNTAADVDPGMDSTANPVYPRTAPWRGNSGYGALFEAWNSGALAPMGECGSILYVGGGHTDYHGNEVIAFDICGLTWSRLSNPHPGPFTWPVADGALPNGPAMPHTYDRVTVAGDKLVLLGAAYNTLTAIDAPTAWVFDLAARKWAGPIQHRGSMEGTSTYDSKRKLVWFQPAVGRPGEVTSLNVATGALAYYGKPNLGQLDSVMGYDPVRDRLVMTSFRYPDTASVAELDPEYPFTGWGKVPHTGRPALKGQHTMAWSPARQGWIVWDVYAGAGVWLMKHDGTAYGFTALTAATNTVTPTAGIGAFEKMQLITVGDTEVLIGQAKLSQGVYAFRLPGGTGVPVPPVVTPDCIPNKYAPAIRFCDAEVPPVVVPPVATLCSKPGVFVCETFAGPVAKGALIKGFTMPTIADGNLVLSLPSNSPANLSGNYSVQFPAIGEGKFLALSYRIKADAAAVALPGRKEFTLWRGSSPCTDLELTQTHWNTHPVFVLYTECGAGHFSIPIPGGTNYYAHFPDYQCEYRKVNASNYDGCGITHAGVWEQFYIELAIGTYGQPNSRVTAWHKTEGGTWKRYVDRSDWTFHGTGGFDNFMLTAYITGKDPAFAHPPGEVRYDDLVMASAPFGADLGI